MTKIGEDKGRFCHDYGSSEKSFERHFEMMNRFRRSHAWMPSIDSKVVKKTNWLAFVNIKKDIQSKNLRN